MAEIKTDRLSPLQKTTLGFVQFLAKLEESHSGVTIIEWEGKSPRQILDQVGMQGAEMLPVPNENKATKLCWMLQRERGIVVGSSDIEVLRDGDCMLLYSPVSSLRGLEDEVEKAFKDSSTKVSVRDNFGFRYSNRKDDSSS